VELPAPDDIFTRRLQTDDVPDTKVYETVTSRLRKETRNALSSRIHLDRRSQAHADAALEDQNHRQFGEDPANLGLRRFLD